MKTMRSSSRSRQSHSQLLYLCYDQMLLETKWINYNYSNSRLNLGRFLFQLSGTLYAFDIRKAYLLKPKHCFRIKSFLFVILNRSQWKMNNKSSMRCGEWRSAWEFVWKTSASVTLTLTLFRTILCMTISMRDL